jgi:hypothetical protein
MNNNDPHPYNPLDIENLAESVVGHLLRSEATPIQNIERFRGAGCYAISYVGQDQPHPVYGELARLNKPGEFLYPIYVGKAVPKGARTGIDIAKSTNEPVLYGRLSQHRESIGAAQNLSVEDFYARWIALDNVWIPLAEGLLISRYTPVWNKIVPGFGIHDPGAGRYNQKISRWDVLHPGRLWAPRLQDRGEKAEAIEQDVAEFLRSRLGSLSTSLVAGDEAL